MPCFAVPCSQSYNRTAVIGVLIKAYAHASQRADGLRLLEELKRRKQAGYVPAAAFVNAYLGLGDNEEAFAWLEQGYKEHSNILQWLKVHPYFTSIPSVTIPALRTCSAASASAMRALKNLLQLSRHGS
jgi:hypothetical protein